MQVMATFWNWLDMRRQRQRALTPLDHAARLSVRKFEERQVLSVTAGVVQGVVDVHVTDANQTVTLSTDGNGNLVVDGTIDGQANQHIVFDAGSFSSIHLTSDAAANQSVLFDGSHAMDLSGSITVDSGFAHIAIDSDVEADGGIAMTADDISLLSSGQLTSLGSDIHLAADDLTMAGGILSNHHDIQLSAQETLTVTSTGWLLNNGGFITLDAGANGNLTFSGSIDVSETSSGGIGGTIHLLGETISLNSGARVLATGDAGGGAVLIGGDQGGANAAVHNAVDTTIADDVFIDTSATMTGDGGTVVVWSDDTTEFHGTIRSTGGAESGDGGFAEVSGHLHLQVTGLADLTALHGQTGTLLLDPGSILIIHDPSTSAPLSPFNVVTDGYINQQLTTANLVVSTSTSTDSLAEDLTLDAAAIITWGNTNSLTLIGNNSVVLDGTISNTTAAGQLVVTGGSIDINNSITVTSGTVTLNGTSAVTEGVAGTITASGLELLGSGPFALTNAGNEIGILAASTTGAISYQDATGFSIGVVNSTVGIHTGGNTLTLQAGGAVTQAQGITASGLELLGSGTFNLNSVGTNDITTLAVNTTAAVVYTDASGFDVGTVNATSGATVTGGNLTLRATGAVTQSQKITATGLELLGTGPYTLTNANNNIATLAANTTGAISFTDVDGFSIGTVNATAGVTTTISNLTLQSGGAVTQTQKINAATLELLGTGSYTLLNASNDINTLAASTTGAVSFRDSTALTIGTVNATSGITTSGSDIVLQTGGTLTLSNAISAGIGNVTLNSGGSVTQGAGDTITTAGLELLGAGPFTLTDAGNDVSNLAANTSTSVSFRDANALIVGTVNSTSGITTTGANVALQTGTTLTINNAVSLGVGNITLTSAGNVSQGVAGTITASGLELLGSGPFTLTNAGNEIGILAASTTGAISYQDATGFSIGVVNGTVGINTGGNTLTLQAGGAVTQAQGITASGLELLGSGTFNLNSVGTNEITTLAVNTTAAVVYTDASGFDIGTVNSTSGATVTGGNLTLRATGAVTQSQKITATGLELLGNGPYTLTNASNNIATLAANTNGAISFTDVDGFSIGTVNATVGVTTNIGNVTFSAGGPVTQTQKITAAGLELLGTGAYTLTDATNNVGTLAANTTNAISYRDADAIVIGTVNSTLGITASGSNVTLEAGGAVTQSQKITATGLELLGAGAFTLTNASNDITTLAANTSTSISFRDANAIIVGTVNSTSGITTTGANVALQTGTTLTINNAVSLGAGSITLNSAGNVSQGAAGTITASGLELLGSGPFALTNAGNEIGILAASTTGAISYQDATGFSIGVVNGTVGINTGGNTLSLQAASAVTQAQGITASGLELLGSGTFNLNSVGTNDITTLAVNTTAAVVYTDASGFDVGTVNATSGATVTGGNLTLRGTGAVTQSQKITATGLELLGNGPYTLTNASNNIATLAANTNGAISFADVDGFSIGTVNATVGVTTTISNLTLQSGGAVTQTQKINAATLELLGTGSYTLLNASNDINTLAASTTGAVKFRDSTALTIGTVNATSGITTSGSDVALQTGGTLTLSNAISVGIGNVTLNSGGSVTQGAGATITAAGLELLGAGPFTLTDAGNDVNNLAAATTGAISYRDANGFVISTVNSTNGISTGGNNLSLRATAAVTQTQAISASGLELLGAGPYTLTNSGNDISVLAANTPNALSYRDANGFSIGTVNSTNGVSIGANTLTLQAGGSVTQSQAITALNLELLGTGSYTLNALGNDVTTIAASTTGGVNYRDTNALQVGTVNATAGITTTNSNVVLQTGGALTLNNAINSGNGNTTLNSAGAVTQGAGNTITAAGLELLGTGPFTLTDSANDVATLAANTSGVVSYRDASGFSVGTVNATNGISIGTNTLTLQAGGAVTQSQAIAATNLELLGTGSYALTNASNDVATFAANTSGAVSYRDQTSLAVGTVNSTVGITTINSNVSLQTGNTLTLNNKVNSGLGNTSLNSAGAVTQGAGNTITAAGLELLGSGPFTLTDAGNEIGTLAASTTGAISYRDATGFSIGTINSTNGISTSGNVVTLRAAGAVNQSQAINASGLELLGTGPYTLTNSGNDIATLAANTSGAVSYRDANVLSVGTVNSTIGITTAGNNLTLQTGGALTFNNSVNTGAGNTSLNSAGAVTQASGDTITAAGLELLGAGPFTLTDGGNDIGILAGSTTGAVSYRDANGFSIGTVNATNGLSTGGNNLTLRAAAAVTQTQAISASGLELLGTGSYTLTNAGNDISTLAASTPNTVSYRDSTGFSIGTVNTTNGISIGANNLSLQAGGAVTQSESITASGLELLGSGPFTLTAATNEITTIAANTTGAVSYRDNTGLSVGTVNSTSGIATAGSNLTLQTGGTLTLNNSINVGVGSATLNSVGAVTQGVGNTITASGLELLGTGPFTLTDAGNDIGTLAASTAGVISFRDTNGFAIGTVNATNGVTTGGNSLTLRAGGAVTQTQTITASNLELLGSGPYTLANAGNDVTTLAANTSGAISYRDANALLVGTVNATVGITTGGNNLTLQTGTTLTLNNKINSGVGDTTLNSGGAVTQGAGNTIVAAGLELLGAGPVTLTDAGNDVGTLAANTTGVISYRDTNGFAIGTVNSTNGISTSGNIVTLRAAGAVTQTQAIIASGLELLGSGSYTLANANNNVSTLAASTTAAVSYRDTDGFSIGTVNSTNGITTGGNNLTLQAGAAVTQTQAIVVTGLELLGSGPFTLTNASNDISTLAASTSGSISYRDSNGFAVGTVNSTTGINTGGNNLSLQSGAAVTQSQSILASGLELLGTGPYTLTNASNDIATLAASTTGTISYRDASGFAIGTVNATNGVSTGGNNLTLRSGGAVTQTQAITAAGLELLGTGPYTLTAATNNVTTLAASVNGSVVYTDADALSVGAVGGTTGISTAAVTASGFDVLLTTNGALTLANSINAGTAGVVTLRATTGGVSESASATVTADKLLLLGAGTFTLGQSNSVNTIAGNLNGALTFVNNGALSVGTVTDASANSAVGIITNGQSVSVSSGGVLTVNQSINTSPGAGGSITVGNAVLNAALVAGAGSINLQGGGNNLVINAAQSSATTLNYSARQDIIIGATVTTTDPAANINLTADSDLNGTGGVQVLAAGQLNSAKNVSILGSDLVSTGTGTADSVRIDADGANDQVLAVGDITISHNAAAPAGAVLVLDGKVHSTNGNISLTAKSSVQAQTSLTADLGSIAVHSAFVLTGDELLVAGNNVTFDTTVDGSSAGGQALTVNAAGITTFTGTVGATSLKSLTTDASGSTRLNANVTTSTTQVYGDNLTLTNNVVLNGSSLTFAQKVDSDSNATPRSMTVNSSGAGVTAFEGLVGSVHALASLTTNADGTTDLNGGTAGGTLASVTTTGAQTYNDAVVLTDDATLQSTGAGNVTFQSTVRDDGSLITNSNLIVNTAGITTFNGIVGGGGNVLASVTTDAAGSTSVNANITTSGAQHFGDSVVLTADVVATSTSSGSISFDSTVNATVAGSQGLTINTSGSTTFTGAVGAVKALKSLATDATGTTNLNANVSTTGTQTFGDAVNLTQNVQITSTGVGAAGDIVFSNTVNGAHSLTVNTGGNELFNGLVGNSTALTSLTTNSAVNTTFNSAVQVAGNVDLHMAGLNLNATLTTTAGGLTTITNSGVASIGGNITSAGNLLFAGSGGITLGANLQTTGAGSSISVNTSTVTITGDRFLTTNNGAILLDRVLTNLAQAHTLTLDAGTAQITVDNNVGVNGTELAGFTVLHAGNVVFSGVAATLDVTAVSITNTGSTTFNGAATIDNSLAVHSGSDIVVNSAISAAGAGTAIDLQAGAVSGSGSVNLTSSGSLLSTAIGSDIQVQAGATSGNILLTGLGSNITANDIVTLTAPNGSITGLGTVTGASLQLSAATGINDGTVSHGGLRTNADNISAVNTQAFIVNIANTHSTLTTVSNLQTVGADLTFKQTGGGNLAFTGQISSGSGIVNGGNIWLENSVTGSTLTFANTATLSTATGSGGGLTVSGVTLNFATAPVFGAGNITIIGGADDTIIDADLTVPGTIQLSARRDVIVRATVTASASGSDVIVNADSDNDGVGGAWIDESALTDAKLVAGHSVQIQGSDLWVKPGTAESIQIDADGINNQVLAGSDITLTGKVIGGPTPTTLADVIVAGRMTATNGGISVSSAHSIQLGANQTAHNDIILQQATLLTNDVTLTSTAAGNVTFQSTVSDDGNALTTSNLLVATAGLTGFNNIVGGGVGGALSSLTTDAAGTTILKTAGVTTTGNQSYHDAVTLDSSNVVLTGVNVSFDSTVDGTAAGGQGLTINASGQTTFGDGLGNDNVGGLQSLAFLTTDANGSTVLKSTNITTSGNQTFGDAVTLASNNLTDDTTLTAVNVSFNSSLDGAAAATQGLTVNASGVTTFGDGTGDDKVGGTNSLTFLTTDAAGSTVLKTTSVTTSANQTYHDLVRLDSNSVTADTTLTGVNVSFDSTLDGTITGVQGLTINASGVTQFGNGTGDDDVGGTIALAFLSTDSPGTTVLKATNVTTTGSQSFHDAVTLASNNLSSTKTLTGTDIAFDSTIDGTAPGAQGLVVNASGVTSFGDGTGNDNIGGTNSLAFLTTDALGSTVLAATSVTTSGNQAFHDAVILRNNNVTAMRTLTGTNISFDSTIDATTIGVEGLTVNSSGVTTFGNGSSDDKVGGSIALASLTTDAAGSTVLKSTSVTTTGDQAYHDSVTLTGNNLTPNATLNGVNISFDGTINATAAGGQGLTVNASGATTFGDGLGNDSVGTTKLAFLTTDSSGSTVIKATNISTTGDQSFLDAVVLTSNDQSASKTLTSNNLTFGNTVDGTLAGAQNLTVVAGGDVLLANAAGGLVQLGNVVIQTADNVTANGSISATSLIQQTGTGLTTLNGAVNTTNASGVQITTGQITLNAPITTTGAGVVSFTNTGLLTINGNITSDGAISQSGPGAVTITEPRSLTTTGDVVSFAGAVTLNGSGSLLTIDTTLGGHGAGANVSFLNSLQGSTVGVNAEDLTINAGTAGAISFVGSVSGLGDFTIVNSNTTTFESSLQAKSVLITDTTDTVAFRGNTNLVTLTTTNQPYNVTFGRSGGPVVTDVITNAVTFLNTGFVTLGMNVGDSITFTGGVTHTAGTTSATGTVTAIAGAVTFGTTSLNGTIQTQGQQVSTQALTLTGSSQIVSTFGSVTGADITFNSTVDGTVAGLQNLTIDSGTVGNILFSGDVGTGTRLGDVVVSNAHDVTAQGNVTSASLVQSAGTGTTTFNGALNTSNGTGVQITTNVVTINNTVTTTGAGGVTVTNAGLLTINGDITADGSVTQNGAGAVTITQPLGGTRAITTTGDSVAFLRAVTMVGSGGLLSIDTTVGGNASGAGITFSNTLNATMAAPNAERLLLNAGTTGDILLTGAVGQVGRLGAIVIANARDVTESGGITAASLTQTTGSGLTTLDGIVDTNTATGVLLTNGAITVNNVTSANSQITMTALNPNGNITLASTIQTTQATGVITLNATNGGIVNGAAANVVNVITDSLVMKTTQGIGSSGTALQTQVSNVAARNSGSGNVRVDNLVGGLLTINAVGGVNGITNDGAASGDITVTNNGSILVSPISSATVAPVTNSTGGSITLKTNSGAFDITVNSPLTASGGNGNITLQAGRNITVNDTQVTNDVSVAGSGTVFLNAGNTLVLGSQNPNTTPDVIQHTVPNDVVIHSGSGNVTNTLPLVYNIQAPQMDASGNVYLSMDIGRAGETNITVTVYWGDGSSTTQTFSGPTHYTFSHQYRFNPNLEDQSAPILVNVQVAHDAHVVMTALNVNTPTESVTNTGIDNPPPVPAQNINADLSGAIYDSSNPNYGALHTAPLQDKVVSSPGTVEQPGAVVFQDISVRATVIPVPGEGISTFPFDTTPPVLYLHFPERVVLPDIHETAISALTQVDTLRLDISNADDMVPSERIVFLEIFQPDGSIERIKLSEAVLDDLASVISKLPDGSYRFQLQEPGETRQRLLLDRFDVRQGKIVDENDVGDRPAASTKKMPGASKDMNIEPAEDVDAPADAEEAVRAAHIDVTSTSTMAPDWASEMWPSSQSVTEEAVPHQAQNAPESNRWSSTFARRAWARAEVLANELSKSTDQSHNAPFAGAEDGQSEATTVAVVQDDATPMSGIALIGATAMGWQALSHRLTNFAPPGFRQGARLFRKFTNRD